MAISQEELGRRLRAAREACGMTQDVVAEELSLSRSTVTQMELGNRSVSSLELDRMAYLYGRDIREFLSEQFVEEDALAVLFRAIPDVAEQPATLEAVRRCLALGREVSSLEELLGIEREHGVAVAYESRAPRTRWEAIQQGDRTATEERGRLAVGWAPIPELVDLLESQGVRTAGVVLPQDVSGLTLKKTGAGFFVVVNSDHHILRRRFSLTHEYAHVLLDRDRVGTVSRQENRDDLIEVRANAFAASFLLPAEGVRQFVTGLGKGRASRSRADVFDGDDDGTAVHAQSRTPAGSQSIQMYDVVLLAHHFGVSRTAALYRLLNLNMISQAQFENLQDADARGNGLALERMLELEPDHEEARKALRRRILNLALEAYRRAVITRAKLIEIADLAEFAEREVLELAVGPKDDAEGMDVDVLVPEEGF